MTEPMKPPKLLAIMGAAAGLAVSMYVGRILWIPGTATFLLFLLFAATSFRPKFFVGAISITGGHVFRMVLASAVGNAWAATAMDIVLLSAGILWLWLRPGFGAALFLGVVQIVSLALISVMFSSFQYGSLEHKALTVDCIWRLMAIVALITGYVALRREQAAIASPALEGPGTGRDFG